MFNDDMKKSLYKKALNKWLVNVALGVDNTLSFETYRVRLTAIDDCIAWLNNNYKKFLFGTILKSEYIKPIVESAEKNVIKWETTVTISKLEKQKVYIKSN